MAQGGEDASTVEAGQRREGRGVYQVLGNTMPIKVRFFNAVGPADWRGLYKRNVA